MFECPKCGAGNPTTECHECGHTPLRAGSTANYNHIRTTDGGLIRWGTTEYFVPTNGTGKVDTKMAATYPTDNIHVYVDGVRYIAHEYKKVLNKAPKWDAPVEPDLYMSMLGFDEAMGAVVRRGQEVMDALNASLPCQSCDEGCGRCNCE